MCSSDLWNIKHREQLSDALRQCPACDDISNGDAVDLASLQFVEKAAHKNRFIHCAAVVPPSPVDNCARDALKLNDFYADCESVKPTH